MPEMKTRIFLIRHGETLWNREQRCQGFSDIALSEKGLEQADRLAKYLDRTGKLSAVYSSDLIRAKKTAEPIAKKQNLEVQTDPRLRDLNQGELEGKNISSMLGKYPELLEKWAKTPKEVIMPGGESLPQLQARAWTAFSEIVERHLGETLAIVGHNLCNITILSKILELDLNNFRRLKQFSASLNEFEISPQGSVILRLNDTHFLD